MSVLSLPSYNELLFIIDTCQGASMYERFYSPNIMALASSQVGEDSLSVSAKLTLCCVSGSVICFKNVCAILGLDKQGVLIF